MRRSVERLNLVDLLCCQRDPFRVFGTFAYGFRNDCRLTLMNANGSVSSWGISDPSLTVVLRLQPNGKDMRPFLCSVSLREYLIAQIATAGLFNDDRRIS